MKTNQSVMTLSKTWVGFLVAAFILIGTAESAYAKESKGRTGHRFGVYVGILEPLPSLISLNGAINVFDFLRVNGGYGQVKAGTISLTTIGAGAKLFVPGWNFSPTVGLSWAQISMSGKLAANQTSVFNFDKSMQHFYIPMGLDWQTPGGFHLGVGYNLSLRPQGGGMPYLTIGWFF